MEDTRPWQCRALLGDLSSLPEPLAEFVRGVCSEPIAADRARFCPLSLRQPDPNFVTNTLPQMSAATFNTSQGQAAAMLFREVCTADRTILPWPCEVPKEIMGPDQCLYETAASDACQAPVRDVYGQDLGGYNEATQDMMANSTFASYACAGDAPPTFRHRIMCRDGGVGHETRNAHANQAFESLHRALCE